MTNEVLFELWTTKDNIAKEHDYDIDSLAAYYRDKQVQKTSSTGTSTTNAEQGAEQNTTQRIGS
jgi:hypothetical protein